MLRNFNKIRNSILVLVFLLLVVSFRQLAEPTPYIFEKMVYFPEMPVANDNPITIEGVELGRFLFYDSILSRDKSFSCASCHRQENAFADNKKFSIGIDGKLMSRNTLPLFNLAWYEGMFWDGRAATIEEQVFQPVSAHDEMDLNWKIAVKRIKSNKFYKSKFEAAFGQVPIDSILIAKAIAQFERTLISSNSKYDLVLKKLAYFTPDEYAGFEIMNDQTKGDCLHCHLTDANALGTNGKFSNNGLDAVTNIKEFKDFGKANASGKNEDYGVFKIPSLRNIAVTAPYMHDGRFNTLEEVIDFYSEGLNYSPTIDSKMGHIRTKGAKLSPLEKQQIIAFLHTLTDTVFIQNKKFSNPFKAK